MLQMGVAKQAPTVLQLMVGRNEGDMRSSLHPMETRFTKLGLGTTILRKHATEILGRSHTNALRLFNGDKIGLIGWAPLKRDML